MLTCHSSRRSRLDQTVLNQRLDGATAYDRIAGYFRSSLFEVAGEAPARVAGPVRIVCNSDIKAIADPAAAAAAAAVEAPVYRREQGLWPHQKHFAHLAPERHRLG